MKKLLSVFFLVLVLVSCSSPKNPVFSKINDSSWELFFADEFDVDGLPNKNNWGYDIGGGGWGNGERQFYTDSEKNAFVKDGKLVIRVLKEMRGYSPYTSARLVSKKKQHWLYGRIEVRAKLPSGRGIWSAIWMMPEANTFGGWPYSGEIDIMENVGFDPKNVYGTIHTGAYNHQKGTHKQGGLKFDDLYKDYHTYAVEWFEDRLDFYIDDQKYFTFKNENPEDSTLWPYKHDMYLIMNVAVGGGWGGQQGIDDKIFPTEMNVDFVRVFKQK